MMYAAIDPDFALFFAGRAPIETASNVVDTDDRKYPMVIPLVLGSILINTGLLATLLMS